MFRQILSKVSSPAKQKFTGIPRCRLFSTSHYFSHLQPFKPHTKEFLALQLRAHQLKNNGGTFAVVNLSKGTELLGLTGNLNSIYGCVPLYENIIETPEIKFTQSKLGVDWVIYRIEQDIECVTQTNAIDRVYYVHDDFLEQSEKLINKNENPNALRR